MLLRGAGLRPDTNAGQEALEFVDAVAELAAMLQLAPDMSRLTGHEAGRSWVCLAYREAALTRNALMLAFSAVNQIDAPSRELLLAIKRQLAWARGAGRDHISALLEAEAHERGIPCYNVSSRARIRQFGQGVYGWHFFEAAQQSDSLTGHGLSRDKIATLGFLEQLGFPHPPFIAVTDAREAVGAAGRIGYPCVIKPSDRGRGKGVTVGVGDAGEAGLAFEAASRHSAAPVLVEALVPGHDHRIAVFGGRVTWVYRLTPACVTGDGRATLHELINKENASRSNEDLKAGLVRRIAIDDALVSFVGRKGLDMEMVIPEGQRVFLRGESNISRGGTLDDVTARAHPENIEMAEQLAWAFRLQSMGLDFITTDISRSWREGGAIIEINGTPGIAGAGDAHHVLKGQFPLPKNGRVPSFLVVGQQCDEIARLISQELSGEGLCVGESSHDVTRTGSFNLRTEARQPRPLSIRALALYADTEVLVVSATESEILTQGLPLDRFDCLIWQQEASPPETALEGLLRSTCREVQRAKHFAPEALRSHVKRVLEERQREVHAYGDHLVIEFGPTPREEGNPAVLEAGLSAWRPPCVPLDSIERTFSELLGLPYERRGELQLLTLDRLPEITARWLSTVLMTVGRDVQVTVAPMPPGRHASQVRRARHTVVVPVQDAGTAKHALLWVTKIFNGIVNAHLLGQPVAEWQEVLKPDSERYLRLLKQ